MKSIIFAIFFLGIFLPPTYSRQVQFYRKDYTYIEKFNAFYKVHPDVSGSAWSTALFTCDEEGATLFYPKVEGEWTLVKNLTDKMTKLMIDKPKQNVTDIFVGLHNEFDLGEFMTIDGDPSTSDNRGLHENCMTMNIHTGFVKASSCLRTSETSLPFVCKKVDDESCPTVDLGYKYAKASKKCYKVNEKPMLWQHAMKICFLEGGILAVIEDNAQAQDITPMLKPGTSYFVGVGQLNDYGQKISDIYQRQSYRNSQTGFEEYGTVVNQDNSLFTEKQRSDKRLPFICEMKVAG